MTIANAPPAGLMARQWPCRARPAQRLPFAAVLPLALLAALGMAWPGTAQPESLPATQAEWSAAALRDVNNAYALLKDNHPGMVDADNPQFRQGLEDAQRAGIALAAGATDAAGYATAILRFSALLRDGHAGAFPKLPEDAVPARQWPGFVPTWRSGRMLVQYSDDPDIPPGSEILGCEGQDIRSIVLNRAFALAGRPAEDGQWWVRARDAFVDSGQALGARPQACSFARDGHRWTATLRWQAGGSRLNVLRVQGYNGHTQGIGLKEPLPGLFWLSLPDFELTPENRAQYQSLYRHLAAKRAVLRTARAVVLDLRGNQGGSSQFSRRVAELLWGRRPVRHAMQAYFAATFVQWRPSPGNEAYLRAMGAAGQKSGDREMARVLFAIADKMALARARGEPLVMPEPPGAATARQSVARSPFHTPVFVIVPGQCASACLDALDVFTRFANTKLIGAPSSGDSKYMEVRVEELPSGMAAVIIPMKMWINRPRGHAEIYRPAIEVDALDWSMDDFLAVIAGALKGMPAGNAAASGTEGAKR